MIPFMPALLLLLRLLSVVVVVTGLALLPLMTVGILGACLFSPSRYRKISKCRLPTPFNPLIPLMTLPVLVPLVLVAPVDCLLNKRDFFDPAAVTANPVSCAFQIFPRLMPSILRRRSKASIRFWDPIMIGTPGRVAADVCFWLLLLLLWMLFLLEASPPVVPLLLVLMRTVFLLALLLLLFFRESVVRLVVLAWVLVVLLVILAPPTVEASPSRVASSSF
mmetsp:Transcript_26193/g.46185  ORF Transcript_26193/g.46185 Transcript_26193/m.46185 type:complete len:221 (-) Transcript_26193:58-720(-)